MDDALHGDPFDAHSRCEFDTCTVCSTLCTVRGGCSGGIRWRELCGCHRAFVCIPERHHEGQHAHRSPLVADQREARGLDGCCRRMGGIVSVVPTDDDPFYQYLRWGDEISFQYVQSPTTHIIRQCDASECCQSNQWTSWNALWVATATDEHNTESLDSLAYDDLTGGSAFWFATVADGNDAAPLGSLAYDGLDGRHALWVATVADGHNAESL